MVSRNAEKQHRYRQRLRARGLVHVQGWVTPEQAEAIRRIMAERAGEVRRAGVASRPARSSERSRMIPNRNEEPSFYG
jgi:hypothetical protein